VLMGIACADLLLRRMTKVDAINAIAASASEPVTDDE